MQKNLLENEKELWEHNTIVDLIRNDLSMVSKDVELTKFRYVDHIKAHKKDLLQASSEIKGKLLPDWKNKLGEIILTMLPAGSISGAPKKKTLEIIAEAEEEKKRVFYRDNCEGLYKCKISYNDANCMIEYAPYTKRKIKTLQLVDGNKLDYSMKYTNRKKLDALLKQRGSSDEVLIVKQGLITDTTFANIVLFDGSQWLTPRIALLEGTQRNRLIQEKKIIESDISIHELKEFKSFKLINAMLDFEKEEEKFISMIKF